MIVNEYIPGGASIHSTISACAAVGGNHEAVNYLWELYYGGWAAPNIRYLGHAGVINFGGLRIAGLSGIFKGKDYKAGHHEKPPYCDSTMRDRKAHV